MKKIPQNFSQKTFLLHDSYRVHKARIVKEIINECEVEEFQNLSIVFTWPPVANITFKNSKALERATLIIVKIGKVVCCRTTE